MMVLPILPDHPVVGLVGGGGYGKWGMSVSLSEFNQSTPHRFKTAHIKRIKHSISTIRRPVVCGGTPDNSRHLLTRGKDDSQSGGMLLSSSSY